MLGGYFVSVVVALAARVQAQSLDPFPDTKANHWVYVALARQGFSKFSSWRHDEPPILRGDVVEAMTEAYGRLSHVEATPPQEVKDLNSQIKRLGTAPAPTAIELDKDFRGVVSVLTLISANERTHEEISDIERIARAFSKDLAVQGFSSEAMVKSLSKVDKRLFLDETTAKELGDFDSPYPDTKKNHWAYEAITRLKTRGLISGYDDGMLVGNRLWTRGQFAVRIHSACSRLGAIFEHFNAEIDSVNEEIKKLHDAGRLDEEAQRRLKARLRDILDEVHGIGGYDADIADLKRLISVFGRDMSALGLDVEDILHTLNSYNKPIYELTKGADKFEKAIEQGFSGGPKKSTFNSKAVSGSDQLYFETTENHWVFQARRRLKADALLIEVPPDGSHYITWRPFTRRDFALNFLAAYTKLLNVLDYAKTESARIGVARNSDELVSYNEVLESYQSDIVDLERLFVEFSKELSAAGHDVKKMTRTLDRLKPSGKQAPNVAGR